MGFQVRQEDGSLPFITLALVCPSAQLCPKGFSNYHQHGNLAPHMGIFSPFCAQSCSSGLAFHGGGLEGSKGLASHPGLNTAPPL